MSSCVIPIPNLKSLFLNSIILNLVYSIILTVTASITSKPKSTLVTPNDFIFIGFSSFEKFLN